jgi:hypothetical protein
VVRAQFAPAETKKVDGDILHICFGGSQKGPSSRVRCRQEKRRSRFSRLKLERACKQVHSTSLTRAANGFPGLRATDRGSNAFHCLSFCEFPRNFTRSFGLRDVYTFSLLALAASSLERVAEALAIAHFTSCLATHHRNGQWMSETSFCHRATRSERPCLLGSRYGQAVHTFELRLVSVCSSFYDEHRAASRFTTRSRAEMGYSIFRITESRMSPSICLKLAAIEATDSNRSKMASW